VIATAQVNKTIFLVDDDVAVSHALTIFLEASGYHVRTYHSAKTFLEEVEITTEGIILLDLCMNGISGLELQAELSKRGILLPIIFITGRGDMQTSVKAIKGGAIDFLEKPLNYKKLLKSIREAFSLSDDNKVHRHTAAQFRRRYANLKDREREVMQYVVIGKANKDIARLLGLSVRTIEVHRMSVMKKMGAESLSDLVRKYAMCQDPAHIPNENLTKQRRGS
jgi:FixJ family two-component response regulator